MNINLNDREGYVDQRCNLDEPIQDQIDEYARCAAIIINDPDNPPNEFVASTLRLGLATLGRCKLSLRELQYFREKFTKVKPSDVEMSAIKNCYIGKCKCGQLLIQSRDRCCPRCNQFIDWPEDPSRRC